MPWSDVFPVLDDVHVDDYLAEATAEERDEMDGYFRVAKRLNGRPKAKWMVATCLFWKPHWLRDKGFKAITREAMMKGTKLRKNEAPDKRKTEPWNFYVMPVLLGAEKLREQRPDVVLRVYLAADLEFLVPDLVERGVEVYLMEHSSIVHNPGAMWRYLAHEDAGPSCGVTVCDSDILLNIADDLIRTEALKGMNLGGWRVPQFGILNVDNKLSYRPMLATQNGCRVKLPAGDLMKALIWNMRHGRMVKETNAPGLGLREIAGSSFPDYGFDEFYLMTAVYPRLAAKGLLTFVSTLSRTPYLTMDIEFATWANRKSELIWWEPKGCCAKPLECEPDVVANLARGAAQRAAREKTEKRREVAAKRRQNLKKQKAK